MFHCTHYLMARRVSRGAGRTGRSNTSHAITLATLAWLVSLLLSSSAGAQSLIEPSPSMTSQDVVKLQLEALANNDEPSRNAGIEQVWAFAHPDNRAMTGPLERFTQMIRGAGYETLLNHRSHRIEGIDQTERTAAYAVRVLARDGNYYAFSWRLGTAELDVGKVWMTTSVSPARNTGQQMTSLLP